MSEDRQTLIDAMASTLDAVPNVDRWDQVTIATEMLRVLLADPVPLLREIAAATKPCETCGQFAGSIHEGQMPGHVYGSNWDWVPCQTCHGSGRVPAVDRAALLAALGYEQVGWTDVDAKHYPRIVFSEQQQPHEVPVWAARVSEETP